MNNSFAHMSSLSIYIQCVYVSQLVQKMSACVGQKGNMSAANRSCHSEG